MRRRVYGRARSVRQGVGDGRDQGRVVGRDAGAEAGDRAVRGDEELLEVPADVAVVALGVGDLRQLVIDRVPTGAVDVDLLVHRERHAVRRRAERGDLLGRPRLLATELVAREPDHAEAALGIRALQLLEPGVLGCEAAPRRHVDDEQGLARVLLEAPGLAVQRVDRVLEDRHRTSMPRRARTRHRSTVGLMGISGTSDDQFSAVKEAFAANFEPNDTIYDETTTAVSSALSACVLCGLHFFTL